jgi:hypothetical protein
MKCLITLAMILGCAEAFAQGVNSNTTIQSIGYGIGAPNPEGQYYTYNVSYVFVVLPTNNSTPASCVTSGYRNYFAIDPTTKYGRALLAAAGGEASRTFNNWKSRASDSADFTITLAQPTGPNSSNFNWGGRQVREVGGFQGTFTFIGANTCNIYPGVEDLAMAKRTQQR